jgi:dTDP-4-amino-4,6-dideoxygalactose transaminase
LTAAELQQALRHENIDCRRYFDPPLHRQRLYRSARRQPLGELPVTARVARRALCPPFYTHLEEHLIDRICDVIRSIHSAAEPVRAALADDRLAAGRGSLPGGGR